MVEPDPRNEAFHAITRSAIVASLAQGRTKAEDIATSVGVSVRTLQRRLGHCGTSYSRLLVDVRREFAHEMLEDSSMPISVIAARLGYSDMSSLSRAFRHWSGGSPSAYRRKCRSVDERADRE